jgi:quinol monooxygenase YgiN
LKGKRIFTGDSNEQSLKGSRYNPFHSRKFSETAMEIRNLHVFISMLNESVHNHKHRIEGEPMVHILIQHRVEDYKTWRPFFDQHEGMRKKYGAIGSRVFQKADEPNNIYLLLDWDNEKNANNFFESSDLQAIMKKAGVVSQPVVTVLKSA